MKSKEVFKDIPGYNGEYQATTKGRIYSVKSEKFMKLRKNHNGYLTVMLYRNGKQKVHFVHLLVLATYEDRPSRKHECNHKNSVRDFNELTNLEWVTKSENAIHGFKYGNREVQKPNLGLTGGLSKLSKKVSKFDLHGKFISHFDGVSEAERLTGIKNISAVCLGKRKSAGGFIWKFKN